MLLILVRPTIAPAQTKLELISGTDITTQLQRAINSCAYFCSLALPPGSFFIQDITIKKEGTLRIVGAGKEATVLPYIGTGTAITLIPQSGRIPIAFEDFKMVALKPGANGMKLAFFEPATIRNFWMTGFTGNIWLTGDGQDQSVGAWIDNARIENIAGEGAYAISMDHVADVYIDSMQAYTAIDDKFAQSIIIDRGAQGIYLNHVVSIGGKNNFVLRSTGQGGDYGIEPSAIHCSSSYFDSATGGSAVVFDSTLGTNEMRTMFSNCWAGGAGHKSSEFSSISEPQAHGVLIEGGKDIQWNGGVIRQNSGDGVHISGSLPLEVIQIHGARILANNAGDSPVGAGIRVTNPNVSHLSILGNTIGNIVEGKGHQKYGISFPNGYHPTTKIMNNTVDVNEVKNFDGVPSCLGCQPEQVRFSELEPAPNGTQLFCTDCGVAQPQSCVNARTEAACRCVGNGSGAFAKRLNSTWLCY